MHPTHFAINPAPRRTARQLLWLAGLLPCGCGGIPLSPLPNESTAPVDTTRYALVARFVHISDAHATDEESPARMTSSAYLVRTAWRPQEAYSLQLLDGMVRAINRLHESGLTIDFVVHTGDATDNVQLNELQWFVDVFDGGVIDPRSGPDDRPAEQRPDALLDPHAPFTAEGIYRQGVHGNLPTIGWYSVAGNHDRFAVGTFPVITNFFGQEVSLVLPDIQRFGIFIPLLLDPLGTLAWAPVSPAHPGPPPIISLPQAVTANPARRYFTQEDWVSVHMQSTSEPAGHGLSADAPRRTWFSTVPLPGLRLIALDTSTPPLPFPGEVYSEGALSAEQVRFLREELDMAKAADELVVVASHHPSYTLQPAYGTAATGSDLDALLRAYPGVVMHIAGHSHISEVWDHGSYVEVETGSIIDAPQEGRVVELWRGAEGVELRYWMFSHLNDLTPGDDATAEPPTDLLRPMREEAARLADADTANGGLP